MFKSKKHNYKQSNAAIARTFRHQPSSGFISETRASTSAATTPPNSASGPEENSPITIDDSDSGEGYGSEDYVSEMDGQELRDSLELQMEGEIEQIQGGENTAYGMLMREIKADHWKKAETNRSLGYNGLSRRKKQLDLQKAVQANDENKRLKAS